MRWSAWKRSWALTVGFLLGTLLLASSAFAAGNTAPAAGAVKNGPGGADCVKAAVAKAKGPWLCVGNALSYEKPAAATRSTWATERVAGAGSEVTTLAVPPDDDYGCETTSVCNVLVDSYTAWVKGNASYGVGTSVWGTFDVVWRQHFNGKWPTWRLHLVWDSGYTVDSDWWHSQVRKELAGLPDPIKGGAYFYPANISSGSWSAWYPSSTGWTYSDTAIGESGNFHDDLYGYLIANGRSFGSSTLHTGHWKSTWNSVSKFYQQKYSSTWY